MKKACVECGRSFSPKRKRQRRCDVHEDVLRSERERHGTSGGAWETIRRQAWIRDGKRCVRCGITVVLRTADITPETPLMIAAHRQAKEHGGADTLDNVETACDPCHDAEHYG